MNLGSRLRELRLQRSLTQDQLAELVGTSQGNVSQWERDKATPSAWQFLPLSEALQVDVSDLLRCLPKPETTAQP